MTVRQCRRIWLAATGVIVVLHASIAVVRAQDPSRDSTSTLPFEPQPIPHLVGGIDSLQSLVVYPAGQKDVEGRVTVQFVLSRDTLVTDVVVVRGLGTEFDEEAMRVVRLARFAVPQVGANLPVRMWLPITFIRPDGQK
jgi:protein TonB